MNSAGFDSGGTLAERFRAHAGDDHSPYAFAMRGMADDWELRAALTIAEVNPVEVDRAGAGEWVEQMLDQVSAQMPPEQDVLTVVWHSVTRMYWPAAETARVEAAVASAKSRMAVVHVTMEYPKDRPSGADRAELSVDGDVLALVGHHGGTVVCADR